MRDLETALTDVLAAFRVGRGNLLSALFRPKIDKIFSPRPRPIICTTQAMTGSKRSCGI